MKKVSIFILSLIVVSTLAFAGGTKEVKFPERGKSITIIVPYAPGGGTDAVARMLAKYAEPHLGVPITIINKTGGGGAVGWAEAAKARPDGYTLTMFAPNIVTYAIMGLSDLNYESFESVLMVNNDPGVIVVAKKNKDLDVVKMLKDPSYVSGGENPNFYLLAIEAKTGVKHKDIPYGGAAERIPAVLGGHVDFAVINIGEGKGQVDAGELIPKAVLSDKRIPALPNTPTLKELGIDAQMGAWRGLGAPKGTPKEIIAILETAFTKALNEPGFKEAMEKAAFTIEYKSSGDFYKFMKEQEVAIKKMLGK